MEIVVKVNSLLDSWPDKKDGEVMMGIEITTLLVEEEQGEVSVQDDEEGDVSKEEEEVHSSHEEKEGDSIIMADNESLGGSAEDSKGEPMAGVEPNNLPQDLLDYEGGNAMDVDPVQPAPPFKARRSSRNAPSKDKANLESVAPQTKTKNTKRNLKVQPQPKLMVRTLVLDVSVQMFKSGKN